VAIFKAKVDISGPLAGFEGLRREQLPWTIARALTMTAQAGQAAGRDLERGVFKLRNDWTVRNTKIKAAQKSKLTAEVYTDTGNRRTGAPDYLEAQQDSAERVPVGGRMHLAVPTVYLRRMCPGVIPDEMRPRALLQYAELGGKRRTRKGGLRGQSASIRGMVFFLQKLHSGAYCIFGRYITENTAYPMYILITRAHIRGRFPLEKTVAEICQAMFERNFKKAAIETMGNDLLRGSGLRLKL
jgi:hypothetical protein